MTADSLVEQRRRELAAMEIALNAAPGAPAERLSLLDAVARLEGLKQQKQYDAAWSLAEELHRDGRAAVEARLVQLGICLEVPLLREGAGIARGLREAQLHTPAQYNLLAHALRLCGRHDDALAALDRGLALAPEDANLLEQRGMLSLDVADTDSAVRFLRRTLEIDGERTGAYLGLASQHALEQEDVAALEQLATNQAGQVDIAFCRAILARDAGDKAAEFRHLDQAHGLAARLAPPWNPDAKMRELSAVMAATTTPAMNSQAAALNVGQRPIFVVGMPRSGSTLVESLLVTDDSVDTVGESPLYALCLLRHAASRYGPDQALPQILSRLDRADLQATGQEYLAATRDVFTQAEVFVDKRLDNFMLLGPILSTFAEARVIHVLRHPLGTILSCYQQYFVDIPVSHSLEHLAHWYQQHLRIMAHWQQQFPGRIHTVRYEEMVGDPETQSRALFEYCGLEWNESVLRFHEARRSVRTASLSQVRRPVYREAAERWKAYEEYLLPARKILGLD